MVSKYTNVALPEELIKEIDRVAKESGLGYKSRGEIVKEAVRNFLRNLAEYKQTRMRKR
jgi:metal-responsive CopG/Arc/MetJ family transcriptional regulator